MLATRFPPNITYKDIQLHNFPGSIVMASSFGNNRVQEYGKMKGAFLRAMSMPPIFWGNPSTIRETPVISLRDHFIRPLPKQTSSSASTEVVSHPSQFQIYGLQEAIVLSSSFGEVESKHKEKVLKSISTVPNTDDKSMGEALLEEQTPSFGSLRTYSYATLFLTLHGATDDFGDSSKMARMSPKGILDRGQCNCDLRCKYLTCVCPFPTFVVPLGSGNGLRHAIKCDCFYGCCFK
eukprot:Gb_06248 [translate_table: standard]